MTDSPRASVNARANWEHTDTHSEMMCYCRLMSILLCFSNVLSGKCLICSTVTRARVPRQAAALFEKYGVAAYFAGHTSHRPLSH
jgi:hypothetical protein